jgi:rod shape-determining protein MreD
MKRTGLALLLFFIFLLEGTVLKWIIPDVWQTQVAVAPHFTLIVILFISLFLNRHWGLAYGLIYGMLHDIVYYGPMIGTYSFTMGLVGYAVGLMPMRSTGSIVSSMVAIIFGSLLFEWTLYGIYFVFQITHVGVQWIFLHQMLPSILINLLFALLIYVPIRKLLEGISISQEHDED